MDLAKIQPHTKRLDLTHPGDAKRKAGLTIELRPLTSDEVQVVRDRHRQEVDDAVASGAAKLSTEALSRQGIELYASTVASWEWVEDLDFHGEKPDCTPANVYRVMSEVDWVLKQVMIASSRTEDFYKDHLGNS